MQKLAIVIVTFKRQELLRTLFDSILESSMAPWRIVITDNENSDATRSIVDTFRSQVRDKWGDTEADNWNNTSRVVFQQMTGNVGGSGGFAAGTRTAYELGAQWFWLMDDDVAILPDGMEKLSVWADKGYPVIQGQRRNFDGKPFYWQYHFLTSLGIPDPIAPSAFENRPCRVMNTACFEGGLFSREIISKIGFPDPRFFIYWDDTMYGYLASTLCNPILIPDFVMRRTRTLNNVHLGTVRRLNSTSDMTRYYIMRNRGFMARYFMVHGDYHPAAFAFGTALTFAKEVIRIAAVDRHFKTGLPALVRGWRDSHAIFHDSSWQPMPALEGNAVQPGFDRLTMAEGSHPWGEASEE